MASSELFLYVVIPSFLRTLREGSSAPLPHLRVTNAWMRRANGCTSKKQRFPLQQFFARVGLQKTCNELTLELVDTGFSLLMSKAVRETPHLILESERVCETSPAFGTVIRRWLYHTMKGRQARHLPPADGRFYYTRGISNIRVNERLACVAHGVGRG